MVERFSIYIIYRRVSLAPVMHVLNSSKCWKRLYLVHQKVIINEILNVQRPNNSYGLWLIKHFYLACTRPLSDRNFIIDSVWRMKGSFIMGWVIVNNDWSLRKILEEFEHGKLAVCLNVIITNSIPLPNQLSRCAYWTFKLHLKSKHLQ